MYSYNVMIKQLYIDLSTFCDMWDIKQPELMPFGIKIMYRKSPPLRSSPPPSTLHPYRSACSIDHHVKYTI